MVDVFGRVNVTERVNVNENGTDEMGEMERLNVPMIVGSTPGDLDCELVEKCRFWEGVGSGMLGRGKCGGRRWGRMERKR